MKREEYEKRAKEVYDTLSSDLQPEQISVVASRVWRLARAKVKESPAEKSAGTPQTPQAKKPLNIETKIPLNVETKEELDNWRSI